MSETIINGIDVSECEFYNNYECDAYRHEYWEPQDNTKDMCKEHENCYFKQLNRLQEENKRLQMLSCVNCGEKYLSPDGAELYEKNVQLQEENEELKKQLEFSRTHKTVLDAERIKYKQALEEIKEDLEQDTTCESRECGCDDYGECLKCVKETMLDKISEVLNDRD